MGKKLLDAVPISKRIVRKVKYLNGKKHYFVWKLIDVQTYSHAHGQDVRRKDGDEL